MTHPDPYIEEVLSDFRFNYADFHFANAAIRQEIESFIRTALEAQKSATKTQRIKDIEEIEGMTISKAVSADSCSDAEAVVPTFVIHQFLTSRKAAIEEV